MAGNRASLILHYLISAVVIGIGIALFEVFLFSSVSSKSKFVLYKLQLLAGAYVLLYFIDRSLWQNLSALLPSSVFPSYVCKCWKVMVAAYIGSALLAPLYSFYLTKEPTTVGWSSWILLGSSLILFSLLHVVRVFVTLLRMFKRFTLLSSPITRDRVQVTMCILATALITWSAHLTATSAPVVVRESVPMSRLPISLNGTKLALLSDIHLGPTVGFTMLERVVNITNSINPDLVILAGDLADGSVDQLREAALALKNLVAPHGLYFVTGNHEYYTSDVDAWFEFLKSAGFHILHNSNVKISKGSDWFCLLGTDDLQADQITYEGHGMDLARAFDGCDHEHSNVLVAHQPNAAKIALDSEYPINLVLSGHTHGGQVFPVTIFAYVFNAFLAGLYKYDATSYVYVSQGTVYYGFPLRFWTRPEITEITLLS